MTLRLPAAVLLILLLCYAAWSVFSPSGTGQEEPETSPGTTESGTPGRDRPSPDHGDPAQDGPGSAGSGSETPVSPPSASESASEKNNAPAGASGTSEGSGETQSGERADSPSVSDVSDAQNGQGTEKETEDIQNAQETKKETKKKTGPGAETGTTEDTKDTKDTDDVKNTPETTERTGDDRTGPENTEKTPETQPEERTRDSMHDSTGDTAAQPADAGSDASGKTSEPPADGSPRKNDRENASRGSTATDQAGQKNRQNLSDTSEKTDGTDRDRKNRDGKTSDGTDTKKDRKDRKDGKESASDSVPRRLPPLSTIITSPFGERRLGGSTGVHFHSGLDIRAHLGWPVVAYMDGVVRRSGFYGRAGIMVELLHPDGRSTRYAHLQTATVREGETVRSGDKIGEVGCTGYTTGAHLHFAMYSARHEALDPARYLKSADEILRPDPSLIPEKLGPQQCNGHFPPYVPAGSNFTQSGVRGARRGPVIRGRSGKPIRIDLNALRNYRPPEIPLWNSRLHHR